MRLHESLHTKNQGFQLCHDHHCMLTRRFSEMWLVSMGRSNELLEICWRYCKLVQLATSKNYATDWVEGTKKQVCHQHHASVSEEVWVKFWTNRFCLLRISDCFYALNMSYLLRLCHRYYSCPENFLTEKNPLFCSVAAQLNRFNIIVETKYTIRLGWC